ncbi:MAG: hypothetical protein JW717_09385 [Marinilabiliaceae bacterium]|nr:hypothetical protein [Marinilabiliaceae bacterium]
MKIRIAFFICVLQTILLDVQSQENTIIGKLEAGGNPVDFAYLVNKRTLYGTESKNGGIAKIAVFENDTLQFRCLGYRDTSFIVTPNLLEKDTVHFAVNMQEYALDEVKVVWFYSYASFKYAFANLKIDKPYKLNLPTINMNQVLTDQYFAQQNPGIGIGLSIGGGLSKAQKQKQALNNYNKKWERFNNLTSHENISSFTGLEGATLDSFIIYLRKGYKINPGLSDYEIMTSVKMAYDTFLAINQIKIDTLNLK